MRPTWKQRLFAAVAALLPLSASAAPFAYSVDSDGFPTSDNLYRIDLATGDATLIGPVGFADVEGLALAPDGMLYGVDDSTDRLIRINTATGEGVAVGNLGLSGVGSPPLFPLDYGLAFTCDGRLWLSSDQVGTVWSVDRQSGLASAQASLAFPVSGLAGWGNDLFGVGAENDRRLLRYSPADAQSTVAGSLSVPFFDDAGADFDADGSLWMIVDESANSNPPPGRIYRVDRATGAATLVSTTRIGFEGLAINRPSGCENPPGGVGPTGPEVIPASGTTSLLIYSSLVVLVAGVVLRRRA